MARNRDRVARATGRRLVSPLQVHGLRVVGAAEYVGEARADSLRRADPPSRARPGPRRGPALRRLRAAWCCAARWTWRWPTAAGGGSWAASCSRPAWRMIGPPGAARSSGPASVPAASRWAQEVADALRRRVSGPRWSSSRREAGGSPRVDLWEAATRALGEVGVPRGPGGQPPPLHRLQQRSLLLVPRGGSGDRPAWLRGVGGRQHERRRRDGCGANLAGVERRIERGLRRERAATTARGCWWPPSTSASTRWACCARQESGSWGRTGQMRLETKWRRWKRRVRVPLHRSPAEPQGAAGAALRLPDPLGGVDLAGGGVGQEGGGRGAGAPGGQRERGREQVWYPPGGRGDLPGAGCGLSEGQVRRA